MMISTKGRYALRVMLDLAENGGESYIPLKDIALRQEISLKYLESIMTVLSKAGYVRAVHGKGGGYMLARKPSEYSVSAIIEITSGSLAPVECLAAEENTCNRAGRCRTLPMWTELNALIKGYLDNKTLADLL